jgi:hypothetical protein
LLAGLLTAVGCYSGGELEDKQPPPGELGGECINGACTVGACLDGGIGYDPMDPCRGIYCGGAGTCVLDLEDDTPECACEPGYDTAIFTHFCTPATGG